MTLAYDSSVSIPALVEDHRHHEIAATAVAEADVTVAHTAAETYSVLTRLPFPLRLDGAAAAALIDARLPGRWIALDAGAYADALRRLAAHGVAGGMAYDGLIALTAANHDAGLVTLDARASRTYRRLGVRFSLLGA